MFVKRGAITRGQRVCSQFPDLTSKSLTGRPRTGWRVLSDPWNPAGHACDCEPACIHFGGWHKAPSRIKRHACRLRRRRRRRLLRQRAEFVQMHKQPCKPETREREREHAQKPRGTCGSARSGRETLGITLNVAVAGRLVEALWWRCGLGRSRKHFVSPPRVWPGDRMTLWALSLFFFLLSNIARIVALFRFLFFPTCDTCRVLAGLPSRGVCSQLEILVARGALSWGLRQSYNSAPERSIAACVASPDDDLQLTRVRVETWWVQWVQRVPAALN